MCPDFLHIDGRIHPVYIPLIQLLSQQLYRLTEALEVNDFPLPQEFDHIIYIWIVRQPKDIIIGGAGLLFRRQIFRKIRNGIALDRHGSGVVGPAGGGGGIDAGGVVHKVGVKAGGFDLLLVKIAGQLMHQSSDHLKVSQLLCAYIGTLIDYLAFL